MGAILSDDIPVPIVESNSDKWDREGKEIREATDRVVNWMRKIRKEGHPWKHKDNIKNGSR